MSGAAATGWRARLPPGEAGFLAVLLAFAATCAVLLPSLQHLIDEGTNVYAAGLIQRGQVPFRDFIYHQPPLYLYALALLPTDHVVWGRGLSFLATCVSGRLLFAILRDLLSPGSMAPALAAALFYFAALQYFGLLALPNAGMLCFALLAARLTLDRRQPVWGGVALVVAVLFKAIAIPLIFAMALCLASRRQRWPELLRFAATLGAGAALSYATLHVLSDGAFSDLVLLQAARYAEGSVLDVLKSLPLLRESLLRWSSPVLNLLYHLHWLDGLNVLLPALLLPGCFLALRSERVSREARVLWIAWLVLSIASVVYVWDVSWEHYHLLYLPPLVVFAGLCLDAVVRRGRLARGLAVGLCGVYAVSGVGGLVYRQQDYGPVLALRGERAPLLTFDATLNVLSRTESPCGLLDYLAQRSPVFLGAPFARFGRTAEDIALCIASFPEVKVVVHQLANTGLLFIDTRLWKAIRALPPERVLYLGDGAREAFDALEGAL